MIKTLIVDDQRLHREYMEKELRSIENLELLQSITDAELAVAVCESRRVDLVIMDIYTGGRYDGIEAAEKIKQMNSSTRVILVTSMLDADYLKRARKTGADSMWYKDSGPSGLREVVTRTLAGEKVFPESTPAVRIGAVSSDELTNAEIRVLRYVVEGYEYDEIGEKLGIGLSTVKWHVSNILHKTGFSNRTRLAVAVSQKKFIVPRIPEE